MALLHLQQQWTKAILVNKAAAEFQDNACVLRPL